MAIGIYIDGKNESHLIDDLDPKNNKDVPEEFLKELKGKKLCLITYDDAKTHGKTNSDIEKMINDGIKARDEQKKKDDEADAKAKAAIEDAKTAEEKAAEAEEKATDKAADDTYKSENDQADKFPDPPRSSMKTTAKAKRDKTKDDAHKKKNQRVAAAKAKATADLAGLPKRQPPPPPPLGCKDKPGETCKTGCKSQYFYINPAYMLLKDQPKGSDAPKEEIKKFNYGTNIKTLDKGHLYFCECG